ncbi:MAG: ATP-grasp domain-containing protein [Gemmataceae bacterium]
MRKPPGRNSAAAGLILEGFVNFDRELSILAVAAATGPWLRIRLWRMNTATASAARSLRPIFANSATNGPRSSTARLLAEMNYVGVLAIEWFQDGPRLLANEMAPRVHNSGHWTIEGAFASQFENHVRAVCGLPLGRCDAVGHSAMYNHRRVPLAAEVLGVSRSRACGCDEVSTRRPQGGPRHAANDGARVA